MRFITRIFYIFFYFIADFKQVSQCFKVLMFTNWNYFLTNIVNKAYTGFLYLENGLRKETKICSNEF